MGLFFDQKLSRCTGNTVNYEKNKIEKVPTALCLCSKKIKQCKYLCKPLKTLWNLLASCLSSQDNILVFAVQKKLRCK